MFVVRLGFKVLENFQYIPVNINTVRSVDLNNLIFGKAIQHFHKFLLV